MKKVMVIVAMAIFLAFWSQPSTADVWVEDFAFGQNTLYLVIDIDEKKVVDMRLDKIGTIRFMKIISPDRGEIAVALCPKEGVEILYNAHGQPWLPPDHNCVLCVFGQELYELFLKCGKEKGIEIIPFKED